MRAMSNSHNFRLQSGCYALIQGHLYEWKKLTITFVILIHVANQGVILAGQEAAHSKRRQSNLGARSVVMIGVFDQM